MRVPLSIFISFYLGHDFKRVCVFFVISLYNFLYFSQQISLLRRETWNIRTDDRATINLEADFRSSNESFDIEYRENAGIHRSDIIANTWCNNSRQEINKSRARQTHLMSLFHSHPRPAKRSPICPSLSLSLFLSLCRCLFCRLKNLPADDLVAHDTALSLTQSTLIWFCPLFTTESSSRYRDASIREWMNDWDTKKCSLRQDESGIRDDGEHRVEDKWNYIRSEERGNHSSALSSISRFRPHDVHEIFSLCFTLRATFLVTLSPGDDEQWRRSIETRERDKAVGGNWMFREDNNNDDETTATMTATAMTVLFITTTNDIPNRVFFLFVFFFFFFFFFLVFFFF